MKNRKLFIKTVSIFSLSVFLLTAAGSGTAFSFFMFKKKPADKKEAVQPAAPETLTLEKAYQLALKRSEQLAIHREQIEEARGRFYQSFAYFLPSVSFLMTRQDQDAPKKGEGSSSGDGVGGSIQRPSTPQKKFVFSQPLFSGFKEFAALAGSKSDKLQQQYLYERARQLLFLNVMESFYALLQAKSDIAVLEETRTILDKRNEELKGRVELGRSRGSELKTSIADQKLIEAEIAQTKTLVATTQELLEFYIGRPITEELSDTLELHQEISDLLYYLGKRDKRPDVQAAEQAYQLSERKITAAQSGFFPKVSLDGNYYTQRVGFQSGTDWDTTLRIDVPIFDGAETIGLVKQSIAQKEQVRLTWEEAKRLAELEIRRNFSIYQSSLLEEEAFRGAQEASEENYKLQTDDYSHSLVNNLEVLDALRRYQDIKRRWNESFYTAKRNYWALKVSAGEIE